MAHNHQALDVKCVEKAPLAFTDEALEAFLTIALRRAALVKTKDQVELLDESKAELVQGSEPL